jgi:acyl-CoA thioester hydrolase
MSEFNLKTMKYEDYPFRTFDKVRYSDTDRQGHVNNAVFSCFSETGRVEFLYDPKRPLAEHGCSFVIVNSSMNLLTELKWPGTVEIGTGIIKIGNSSITMVQGLYQNEKLAATIETVIVHTSTETKRSSPLSDEARSVLSTLLLLKPE